MKFATAVRTGGSVAADHSDERAHTPEISVVMPCLNEAETVGTCVAKALLTLTTHGIAGEVLVADNGSSDGSQQVAERAGARVVTAAARGYGSALSEGIAAAHGKYVLFGDADDSYDFGEVSRFLELLRAGHDLVMGNRFHGTIHPGAMPWHHRYIGNPVLTGIGRLLFRSPVGDFHCGLRAFSKAAWEKMELRTTGMEYASEMVIKATLRGLRIAEIPVDLRPDGRSRPPHLRSFRDGWRHLRFMLLFCPKWLFIVPGLTLLVLGILLSTLLLFGTVWVGLTGFGVHTLLVAGACGIIGEQLLFFGAFAQSFAVIEGLHPPSARLAWLAGRLRLEQGLAGGLLLCLLGTGLLAAALFVWSRHEFGPLDPADTMRLVIPASVSLIAGVQTIFGSFVLSVLQLPRK